MESILDAALACAPVLGTVDGVEYVRLDGVWAVPHADGAAATLLCVTAQWPQTAPARALAAAQHIVQLEAALAERDALIVQLQRELTAARTHPPALAAAVTGLVAAGLNAA